ncbi:chorismate mutase [Buchnera aphidicola (Melanaphis sacchari)]|uniref:Bifunctional chorismate mutase/prephenate dehydratase n=1 Tax=Buchnera aphidicola (Melanaphis sacchari) TaxID=2173854 RepID=A0A2U8DGI9_9GAMM|nr:chorismate mutase [Buchnera aphidicola]AWH90404.1 chorismate mutase [Buchnera aphidicola (Melanaphis sacchari)]
MQSKNDLLHFRSEINTIDTNIVKLLAKRKKLVLNIAQSKIKNNKPIRDKKREESLLNELTKLGKKNHLNPSYIKNLFELIIEESVLIQTKMLQKNYHYESKNTPNTNFSFLGPKGSYSHIAMLQYIKKSKIQYTEKEFFNFEEIVFSVENNISDYAILPIENSCSGLIDEAVNLLEKTNLFIIGEIKISINHCLVATKNTKVNNIKNVYSHPQPFKQCSNFINRFPQWKIQYSKSTSSAMKKIVRLNSNTNAAIGNEISAKIYGLKILLKNLSNKENNTTRFIVLSKQPIQFSLKIPTKTTLIFKSKYNLKNIFNKLNEKKIKIYEMNNKLEKTFFIDIKDNILSNIAQNTIIEINKISNFLKILGCYATGNIITENK